MTELDTKVPITTDPAQEIVHDVPVSGSTVATVKLTNSEDRKVAFKVKTTDNEMFRIKPVMGVLAPGASTTVNLTCHGTMKDPANPPPKQRYVLFSIYSEAEDGKKAWAELKESKTPEIAKNAGKRKNLAIKWNIPPGLASTAPGRPRLESAPGAIEPVATSTPTPAAAGSPAATAGSPAASTSPGAGAKGTTDSAKETASATAPAAGTDSTKAEQGSQE